MHRLIPALALALAACGGPAVPPSGYRDSGAQISSAALFDPSRFADVWHVAAAYGADTGCGPLAETWAPAGPGAFAVTGTACGPNGARAFAGPAQVTGPGRITRTGLRGPEVLWVLWVDADYRVAVIGTPDGSFGRILSRTPDVRPDLLEAAREVLDFNGYDVARLVDL
jgi:apolipoprotein D and lipocalin family protein